MRKLILMAAASFMMSITALADAEVGAAPDPYQKIWETADEEDMNALKAVVWYEAALSDCSQDVLCGVIETVLNRCLSDAFPSKISAVCKQRGQFYYRNSKIDSKAVSEAIKRVQENGKTILPDYDYCYFATKMQSLGKDHLWVGERKANGKPRKGKGMYFCRGK